MLVINFSTVENLIFSDKEAQKVLPNAMFHIFEQWRLCKRIPYLKSLGKQAVLDVLNQITDDDIQNLEHYFGQKIILERLDYSVSKNLKIKLSDKDMCEALCELRQFNYLASWRDEEHLYVSFWR